MSSNPTVTATVEAPRTLGNTGIAGLLRCLALDVLFADLAIA